MQKLDQKGMRGIYDSFISRPPGYQHKTSTRIVELKFLKHGCPRLKKTTRRKLYNSGPLREQLLAGTKEDRNAPIIADLRGI